jgi:hypothetical protein
MVFLKGVWHFVLLVVAVALVLPAVAAVLPFLPPRSSAPIRWTIGGVTDTSTVAVAVSTAALLGIFLIIRHVLKDRSAIAKTRFKIAGVLIVCGISGPMIFEALLPGENLALWFRRHGPGGIAIDALFSVVTAGGILGAIGFCIAALASTPASRKRTMV